VSTLASIVHRLETRSGGFLKAAASQIIKDTLYSNAVTTPITVLNPHKLHASILNHIAGRLAWSLLPLDDCHWARCVRQHVVCHTSHEDPAVIARLESREK
jgi:hypothetical protein